MTKPLSRTLLGILGDLKNAVVWMVSTRPLISKSSKIVPISIVITETFMYHGFLIPLQGPGTYLSYRFFFFLFYYVVSWESKNPQFSKFDFSCWFLRGLFFWLRFGDPFVSQNPREVCTPYSPGKILGCAYTICSYGQISISCTIPSGSPCPSGCV